MLSRCIATFAKTHAVQAKSLFTPATGYGFSNFSDKLNRLKNKNEQTSNHYQNDSALNSVRSDAGLSSFVNRVYKTTGLGVLGAITTS